MRYAVEGENKDKNDEKQCESRLSGVVLLPGKNIQKSSDLLQVQNSK